MNYRSFLYYPTKSGVSICLFIQFSGESFQQTEENIFKCQCAHGLRGYNIVLPYFFVSEANHRFTEHLPFLYGRLNIYTQLDVGPDFPLVALFDEHGRGFRQSRVNIVGNAAYSQSPN